jgi:ABC-type phosphate transport system auxiliary subunit
MSPSVFLAAELIFVGLPVCTILYMAHRFFRLRERKLEVEAGMAAEKAAQYAAHTKELEQRLRVVEQIVTDGGAQTAAQIEALRGQPATKRIGKGANA